MRTSQSPALPGTTHEPPGYACPFCRFQRGVHDEWNQPSDVVAVTERAFARVAPKWWPANPGGVLVIPRPHVENLYALSAEDGREVWDLTQRVAEGIRTSYDCAGTSVRQHNEPAGDQDLWHLHVHVFPRHADDRLYQRHAEARWAPPAEREPYAEKLRAVLRLPHDLDA
ncbi:HIT family protein [Isoptericola sp. NPDC019482]|uniref:HIT family protein n=1 Tax=Isoptericola sp. NPDC019482 TaxID=3154688 RepID=UPI00347AD435